MLLFRYGRHTTQGSNLLFTDKCLTSPTSPVAAAILLPRLSFQIPPVFPLRTLDCHHHHHYHHVTLAQSLVLPSLENVAPHTIRPTPFIHYSDLSPPAEGNMERRQSSLENFSSLEPERNILTKLSLCVYCVFTRLYVSYIMQTI